MIGLGIDLSSTATGLALVAVEPGKKRDISLALIKPKGKTGRDRYRPMMQAIEEAVTSHGADFIGIEDVAFGAKSANKVLIAGYWWEATQLIVESGLPWFKVSPTSRAKFAAGHGKASKEDVKARMSLEHKILLKDDNQADALAVAHMGFESLGVSFGNGLDGRSLKGVKWEKEFVTS